MLPVETAERRVSPLDLRLGTGSPFVGAKYLGQMTMRARRH